MLDLRLSRLSSLVKVFSIITLYDLVDEYDVSEEHTVCIFRINLLLFPKDWSGPKLIISIFQYYGFTHWYFPLSKRRAACFTRTLNEERVPPVRYTSWLTPVPEKLPMEYGVRSNGVSSGT
jgi:hypothetical protein